jgi:hypothetical protein
MSLSPTWTPEPDKAHVPHETESDSHSLALLEPTQLTGDPRWDLVQRIVNTQGFLKSALLSRFLLYVSSRALSGRTEEISECQIGVHVFGRRPGYSRDEDNIVRNYARQLRQRLAQYYEREGKYESLRINIPRGHYVPEFSQVEIVEPVISDSGYAPEPASVQADVGPAPQQTVHLDKTPHRLRVIWLWCGVALLLAGALMLQPRVVRALRIHADPASPLWTQLFDSNHLTLLVPSDDGIVMFQNLTDHSVSLADYINRDYLGVRSPFRIDAQNMADLQAQRYTNVADLDTVERLSHLPEVSPGQIAIRYARELHMDDLKDSNAVLLGSVYSNPWVELFQKNLNFKFSYQPRPNASVITNTHPAAGEQSTYINDAAGPTHRTYAVIALVPNLDNTGWVLIVEGLTMAGTQAAADMLFSGGTLRPFLNTARSANGELNPFEILIETSSFGSNAPQAQIIASRIYTKFPA